MTQVIIPKPIYPSHLDHQNVFYSSISNNASQKEVTYEKLMLSKKPAGAFRLFKEKKQRNKDSSNSTIRPHTQNMEPQLKKKFKLKTRTLVEVPNENKYVLYQLIEPSFDYYDPNTAPAFVSGQNIDFDFKNYRSKVCQKIERIPPENKQKIIVQNIIPKIHQTLESEHSYEMQEEEGQKDDPFIIVKKVQIKKAKIARKNAKIAYQSKKNIYKKRQNQDKIKQEFMDSVNYRIDHQKGFKVELKLKDESNLIETQKSDHSKHEAILEEQKEIFTEEKNNIAEKIQSFSILLDNYERSNLIIKMDSQSQGLQISIENIRNKLCL